MFFFYWFPLTWQHMWHIISWLIRRIEIIYWTSDELHPSYNQLQFRRLRGLVHFSQVAIWPDKTDLIVLWQFGTQIDSHDPTELHAGSSAPFELAIHRHHITGLNFLFLHQKNPREFKGDIRLRVGPCRWQLYITIINTFWFMWLWTLFGPHYK